MEKDTEKEPGAKSTRKSDDEDKLALLQEVQAAQESVRALVDRVRAVDAETDRVRNESETLKEYIAAVAH